MLDGWSSALMNNMKKKELISGLLSGILVFLFVAAGTALAVTTVNFTGGIWNSSGNVGIGTTGPTSSLQVSSVLDGGSSNATGVSFAQILRTSSLNNLNQTALSVAPTFNTNSSNVTNAYGINISPTLTGVYTLTNGYGLFVNAPTVTSGILTNSYAAAFMGGSVGIGTTAPGYKLDVQGTGNFTGQVLIPDPTGVHSAASKEYVDTAVAAATGPFTVSGSNVYVTNTGYNLGIGTTAPAYKLQVVNAGSSNVAYLGSTGSNSSIVNIDNFAGGNQSAINFDDAGTAKWQIGKQSDNSFFLYDAATVKNTVQITTAGLLQLGESQQLSLPSAGNVGIGTASPQSLLDVNGNVLFGGTASGTTGNVQITTGGTSPISNRLTYGTDGTGWRFAISKNQGGTVTDQLTIQDNGNVGIGTIVPTEALEVNGNIKESWANTYVGWNYTGGGIFTAGMRLVGTRGLNLFSNMQDSAGYISFNTGITNPGTEAMRIISSGNVGIGTTTPSQPLTVTGNIYATGNITCGGTCGAAGAVTGSGTANVLAMFTGGSVIGNSSPAIYENGTSVGIGVASPGYKLDVMSGGTTTARFGTAAADTVVIGGGSGKITAGTFDPLYTIGGENYATYLPGMTGNKEETAGTVTLTLNSNGSAEATLDFASAAKGSDLWLFRSIIDASGNFAQVTISLTPSFDGRVWYEKDKANNRIVIHGTAAGEVSYQLIGKRFDWQSFPNTRPASDGTGLTPSSE
jgi:hypothetical protein